MPYIYILECIDGTYYTGSSWNLEQRLWEHQNGQGANYTARRLPVKLVFCEECERVEDAYRREKQIQGWSRWKKQALMAANIDNLRRFAKCCNESHWQNAQIGFDSAQPTKKPAAGRNRPGFDSAQPTKKPTSG